MKIRHRSQKGEVVKKRKSGSREPGQAELHLEPKRANKALEERGLLHRLSAPRRTRRVTPPTQGTTTKSEGQAWRSTATS